MSKRCKRFLALILSATLCVAGLPINGFAEAMSSLEAAEDLTNVAQSPEPVNEDVLASEDSEDAAQDDTTQEDAAEGTQTTSDELDLGPIDAGEEQDHADTPEENLDAVDVLDETQDTILEDSANDAASEVSVDDSNDLASNDLAVEDADLEQKDADAIDVVEDSKLEADDEDPDAPAIEEAIEKDSTEDPEEADDAGIEALADKDKAIEPTSDQQDGLEAQASTPSIEYRTHVQSIGWQGWKKNGALSGTSGRGLRLEAMRIRLKNASGSVVYSTHAQTYGWLQGVQNGAVSGTTGEGKRLEAVRIHLTGNVSKTHDVWYRAHVQTYGWQNWVKNGQVAGTSGEAKRVEALEILLVKKGDAVPTNSGSSYHPTPTSSSPNVYYQTHVQTYGWQGEVSGGSTAGTSGEGKRLEALRIALRGVSGGIKYRTHVQSYGWQGWRSNGALSGTSGEGKRLEALQVKLTGSAAQRYDIWYRCHIQSVGWMGWTKNGAYAGSAGLGLRMEAIQIKLMSKGSSPSADDAMTSAPYLTTPDISYRAYLRSGGWQGDSSNGATAGTTGKSARIEHVRAKLGGPMEGSLEYAVSCNAGSWLPWAHDWETCGSSGKNVTALRMKLSGSISELFDVWYRVHVASYGWLGWTKNGSAAGSDSATYPVEAYQVRILRKDTAAPGTTKDPYIYTRKLNGVDISGWDEGINIAETEGHFFIIKATEGVTTSEKSATRYNPSYKTWANQVLNSGRLLGFYHYANGDDAVKEADSFYEAIKDFKGRAIACLDWEGDGNKLFDTGMDVAWCKKFLDRLKSKFGGTPFLYTSKNYTNAYDWSPVAKKYPLWGAEYPDFNDVNGYQANPWQSSRGWGAWGSKPTIFQYTGTGVLEKNGNIEYFDFDLFYGTKEDWQAYCK